MKSTTCRNQYLLDLLSANSHQKRFYETDLKNLMKVCQVSNLEKCAALSNVHEVHINVKARLSDYN